MKNPIFVLHQKQPKAFLRLMAHWEASRAPQRRMEYQFRREHLIRNPLGLSRLRTPSLEN